MGVLERSVKAGSEQWALRDVLVSCAALLAVAPLCWAMVCVLGAEMGTRDPEALPPCGWGTLLGEGTGGGSASAGEVGGCHASLGPGHCSLGSEAGLKVSILNNLDSSGGPGREVGFLSVLAKG